MNNIFIVHTENREQENALKAFAKALKIKIKAVKENPYDPEFVARIKQSELEFEEDNYSRVEKKDLKKFLGL